MQNNVNEVSEFLLSDNMFHSMLKSLPVGVYRISPDGKLIFANKEFAKLMGHMLPHSFKPEFSFGEEFPVSINNPGIREKIDKYGEIKGLETRWKKPDGTILFIRENITAIKNASGKTIYYDGIVENISEKIRETENFRKLTEAVEQSPVSIIVTDLQGKIEYANPRACQTSGYSFKELYGSNPRILKSGESEEEIYSNLWKTILSGSVWRGLFHNRKKSGELYWESATIAPVTDKDGMITHFVAAKEDITEKRSFEQSLVMSEEKYRILAEELGKINATKDKLLSVISHDLRGPLGSFNQALNIFSSLSDNDKNMKSMLMAELKNESDAIYEMLENLLQWSKIQQNAISISPVSFSVNETINEAIQQYSSRALKKQLTIQFTDHSDFTAKADKESISLVIRNLLANAIKFTKRGGSIRITLTVTFDQVKISFEDNGIGIREADLRNLFTSNELFRTYGTDGEKGRGMGLYLCKYITEINNGEIIVENTSGHGSKFTLSLPRS